MNIAILLVIALLIFAFIWNRFKSLDEDTTDIGKQVKWVTGKPNHRNNKLDKEYVLIAVVGSDWCPPCIQLINEVFTRTDELNKKFPNLCYHKIDFPKNKELKRLKKQGAKTFADLESYNKMVSQYLFVEKLPTVRILKSSDVMKFNSGEDWESIVLEPTYNGDFDDYMSQIEDMIQRLNR